MKNEKNEKLTSLFISELQDMMSAETQILAAFPETINAAESKDLKHALEAHFEETKDQVERLRRIFYMMQADVNGETCEAMQGLIQEVKEAVQEHEPSALRDAALISKLQRIEHYEISVYGTLRTFAKELGLDKARELLNQTLDEEAKADKALTKIAEGGLLSSGVNRKANQ